MTRQYKTGPLELDDYQEIVMHDKFIMGLPRKHKIFEDGVTVEFYKRMQIAANRQARKPSLAEHKIRQEVFYTYRKQQSIVDQG